MPINNNSSVGLATACRETEIQAVMSRLENALANLASSSDRLVAMLVPVLSCETPGCPEVPENRKNLSQIQTPLGNKLAEIARGIESLNERTASVLSRIEL